MTAKLPVSTGPVQGPTGPIGVTMVMTAAGPQVAIGPRGSLGATGAMGPGGSHGATGPQGSTVKPAREVHFPSKEGRVVASLESGNGRLDLWAKASSTAPWHFSLNVEVWVSLLRGSEAFLPSQWDGTSLYDKSPEELAKLAAAPLEKLGCSPDREEMVAAFTVAKKEAMRMLAVVATELLISHVSFDEIGDAWRDANALRVMME